MDYWETICDYLPTNQLCKVTQLSHTMKQHYQKQIYYRRLSTCKLLSSLDYLLPIDNKWSTLLDDSIRQVLKHLNQPYYCIAGGFPSFLYHDETLPPTTSDIDIFVLGHLSTHHDEINRHFHSFITWFRSQFTDVQLKKYRPLGTIYTLSSPNFPYVLQFIFTTYSSLTEILMHFDSSHARCGIFQNTLYVTWDAQETKESKIAYFNVPSTVKRYWKVAKRGFSIYSFTEKQMEELREIQADHFQDVETELIEDDLSIEPYYQCEWLQIYNVERLMNKYNQVEEIDIRDFSRYKSDLYVFWKRKSFNEEFVVDDIGAFLYFFMKKPTNIPGLFMLKHVHITYTFTYLDYRSHGDMGSLYASYETMVYLKNALLEIMNMAHRVEQTPEYIATCTKDLIGNTAYRDLVCTDTIMEPIAENLRSRGIDVQFRQDIRYLSIYPLYPYIGYMYRDFIYVSKEENIGAIDRIPEVVPNSKKEITIGIEGHCRLCPNMKDFKSGDKPTIETSYQYDYGTYGLWYYSVLKKQ